jgi:hypothetical protein
LTNGVVTDLVPWLKLNLNIYIYIIFIKLRNIK